MNNRRVLKNAGWIVGCRLAQALLNLVVGMLSARYLGPSGYGLISYAASVVAFAVPLMRLGLHAILVEEITCESDNEERVIGTALGMSIISAVCCIAGVVTFVYFANAGERITLLVCGIYSLSLLFQAAEMVTYWFQAKLLSKYPSLVMLVAYAVASAYKIWLLISGKSVTWFAGTTVLEHFLVAVLLLLIYKRKQERPLGFSRDCARRMLNKSKYYILAGVMLTVFQQTDRLMLKLMLGDAATGYYSAAIGCSGIFGFVYAAVIDSARPIILEKHRGPKEQYEKAVSCLYCVVFYISLAQCIIMAVFAEPIVFILYGKDYAPAANVLRVCVWYVTYAYFGSIFGIWVLCEKKYKYVLVLDTLGAFVNVVLNWMMIPTWGIEGAAVASVITRFFTSFLLSFLIKPLRENAWLLLRGIHPKYIRITLEMLWK